MLILQYIYDQAFETVGIGLNDDLFFSPHDLGPFNWLVFSLDEGQSCDKSSTN